MKRKLFVISIIAVILFSLVLSACQSSAEVKPTPVFEFKQFNPTKAPIQPTAIRGETGVVSITETVAP